MKSFHVNNERIDILAEEIYEDSWSAKSGSVLEPTPTLARPVRHGRVGIDKTP